MTAIDTVAGTEIPQLHTPLRFVHKRIQRIGLSEFAEQMQDALWMKLGSGRCEGLEEAGVVMSKDRQYA